MAFFVPVGTEAVTAYYKTADGSGAHKDMRSIVDQFTQVTPDKLQSLFSSAVMALERLRSAAIELTDEAASKDRWRTFSERDATRDSILRRLQARDSRPLP